MYRSWNIVESEKKTEKLKEIETQLKLKNVVKNLTEKWNGKIIRNCNETEKMVKNLNETEKS